MFNLFISAASLLIPDMPSIHKLHCDRKINTLLRIFLFLHLHSPTLIYNHYTYIVFVSIMFQLLMFTRLGQNLIYKLTFILYYDLAFDVSHSVKWEEEPWRYRGELINSFVFCQPITVVCCGQLTNESARFL